MKFIHDGKPLEPTIQNYWFNNSITDGIIVNKVLNKTHKIKKK